MHHSIRKGAAVTALALGAVLVAAPAFASGGGDDGHKEVICHPDASGKYERIDVDKASVHFDENGQPKHVRKDGRTDVYSVGGLCPGDEPVPTETETTTQPPVTETTTTPPVTETTTTEPPVTETTEPPVTETTQPPTTTTEPPVTETTKPPVTETEPPTSTTTTEPTKPVEEPVRWVSDDQYVDCEEGIVWLVSTTLEQVGDAEPVVVDEQWSYRDATKEECASDSPRPTRDVTRPTTKTQWHMPAKPVSTTKAAVPTKEASAVPQQELAYTGANLAGAGLGAVLLVAGGLLMLAGRRVRQH